MSDFQATCAKCGHTVLLPDTSLVRAGMIVAMHPFVGCKNDGREMKHRKAKAERKP